MQGNTGNSSRACQASSLSGVWQTLVFQTATLCIALSLSFSSVLKPLTPTPLPGTLNETSVLAALSTATVAPVTEVETPTKPQVDDRSDIASMEELEVKPRPVKKPAPRLRAPRLPLQEAFYRGTTQTLVGMASWYGPGFHGRRAADGSRFDQNALTAAHKTLPFGTVVRVTNTRTGKSCLVRITDRGPYAHGRIIDLSMAAADAIGMRGSGVARVTVEVLTPRDTQTAEQPHAVANVES